MDGFFADLSGSPFAMVDAQLLTGVGTLTRGAKVGRGWKGSSFAWVGGGGDGVIYALTWSGDLKWFKYDSTHTSWDGATGRVVGTGFVPGRTVINIGPGLARARGGPGLLPVARLTAARVPRRRNNAASR